MERQTQYLTSAIKETYGENAKTHTCSINHQNGYNLLDGTRIPLTFPKSLVSQIEPIQKQKDIEYNFIGTITPKRESG